MSMNEDELHQTNLNRLIEIWKVLEILTVSLDRMGEFWRVYGEDAAKEALHQYMGPAMFRNIAQARDLILTIIETYDPSMLDQLEEMANNETAMAYWGGPNT